MDFLEKMLEKIAVLQRKHAMAALICFVLITLFLGFGITKIYMQSDFSKELPQDLPIFQLNDKINSKFGGQDVIIVLFSLDTESGLKDGPKDIRNAEMMRYLIALEDELLAESSIEDVTSVGSFVRQVDGISDDSVLEAAARQEAFSSFFSKDYTKTLMLITADVGQGEEKIVSLTELIDDKLDGLSRPAGIKMTVTGSPSLGVTIMRMLKEDAIFTIILASAVIIILLIAMKWSVTKGLLIFTPIALGLTWTMGTLGWLGIPLSIATVGIGAMILGLGVEYGVFMLFRYEEERAGKNGQVDALKKAVPSIGSAILGSGTTTIFGFLALTLSVMPLLQKLGFSLALGIFFSLIAAVFVMPVIIVLEEDLHYWYVHSSHKAYEQKKKSLREMPR